MDETFPDLGSLSDAELKDVIRQLTEEETEISYRRRILHGKIDILRAELVNRLRHKHEGGEALITGEDVQRLTDILSQGTRGELDPPQADGHALHGVRLRQQRGRQLLPALRRAAAARGGRRGPGHRHLPHRRDRRTGAGRDRRGHRARARPS